MLSASAHALLLVRSGPGLPNSCVGEALRARKNGRFSTSSVVPRPAALALPELPGLRRTASLPLHLPLRRHPASDQVTVQAAQPEFCSIAMRFVIRAETAKRSYRDRRDRPRRMSPV